MMTTTLCVRMAARQSLQWAAVLGATLVLGQPALSEDAVSVLMKRQLADMTGKEGTVITVDYAPGAEARVRYGMLLKLAGRLADARHVFTEFLIQMRRKPKHVRKAQAEWIAIAEKQIAG